MQAGIGQFRCFTVLPCSCIRNPASLVTVRLTFVSDETIKIFSVSKPVALKLG